MMVIQTKPIHSPPFACSGAIISTPDHPIQTFVANISASVSGTEEVRLHGYLHEGRARDWVGNPPKF